MHDTDRNGVPDLFQDFEQGVIRLVAVRPNQARTPTRLEFCENGVLRMELTDSDQDGLLDIVDRYDLFQSRTNTEQLAEPIGPDRAMVLHAKGLALKSGP
jgi:hypothetical protein